MRRSVMELWNETTQFFLMLLRLYVNIAERSCWDAYILIVANNNNIALNVIQGKYLHLSLLDMTHFQI